MIVTQHMNGIRQAALELMVESLGADDTARQIESIMADDDLMAYAVSLAKTVPVRTVADGFYDYAAYLFWIRSMIDADVELTVLAEEAEGLRALAVAQQEFERDHPGCPQCGARQYSSTAMRCRSCRMEFRKKR
jgi:NADH pyrophosphatase NudC (nudix superfamily)